MRMRLSTYLKKIYGEKVYRLSLSSGCSCPNRDGRISFDPAKNAYVWDGDEPGLERLTGGCTFCSEGGSGEFAAGGAFDVTAQIEEAKALIRKKTDARKFIAYYQSYSNTYGDVERLRQLYMETIKRDDIVILSLGTRPDCLGDEVMDMLRELSAIKPVWVELGLQTIHEKSARRIHRGYDLPVFEDAYRRLKEAGITVIVHVILGLPGETKEDMLETVRYLAGLSPVLDGIKLQNLQILKETAMYEEDLSDLHIMSMEEYTDLVAECIALLPEETVAHRMTGDGPRRLLVEPLWTLDKKRVLNMLTKKTSKMLQ